MPIPLAIGIVYPLVVALAVGFEPTAGYQPALVFKTSSLNHSDTLACTDLVELYQLHLRNSGIRFYHIIKQL